MYISARVTIATIIIVVLVLAGIGLLYQRQPQGVRPAISSAPALLHSQTTHTVGSLTVPVDIDISIFAQNIPGARVLAKDGRDNFWVSQPGQGTITQLLMREGKVIGQQAVFRNLRGPHGLAVNPEQPLQLYVAEEHAVSRVTLYGDGALEKIADLPAGGGHSTRTLGFGPDGRLYVSIGSSCNVCLEKDARRASILSMNKDGSDIRTVATGLRNTVFFTWRSDGSLWATDMGRDLLGDDIPPDEINSITEGQFYGWPYCYGRQVHDAAFDNSAAARAKCAASAPSLIDIPAHSAPLGLAFLPQSWPAQYRGDLLVAYHGSWNRTVPTGYKVVKYDIDAKGTVAGVQDFISGYLSGSGGASGRPVGIVVDGQAVYITDDKAGLIYLVTVRS